jgi:hypothetical protein
MSFEYPEHPNTNRTDPFQDEEGQNPFGDEGSEVELSDNPYGVPAHDAGPSYQPAEFEAILPHRAGRVFRLGLAGAIMSTLGGLGATGCALSVSGSEILVFLSAGLLLLGLPSAWSAWMLGRHDLLAMRSGAMDGSGLKKTRRGHFLGMAGTLIGAAPILALVLWILKTIGEQA